MPTFEQLSPALNVARAMHAVAAASGERPAEQQPNYNVFCIDEGPSAYRVTVSRRMAKKTGLPRKGLLVPMHVRFLQFERMQKMSTFERGRYAAGLLLEDWVLLANRVKQGDIESTTVGYMGTSPLSQPNTLRRFGAFVEPARLSEQDHSSIDRAYHLATGGFEPDRRIHTFIIGNRALAESVPRAEAMLARLQAMNASPEA